jgi:hypothetical protein
MSKIAVCIESSSKAVLIGFQLFDYVQYNVFLNLCSFKRQPKIVKKVITNKNIVIILTTPCK